MAFIPKCWNMIFNVIWCFMMQFGVAAMVLDINIRPTHFMKKLKAKKDI